MNSARLYALAIKFGLVLAAATGLEATITGAKADTISVGWSSTLGGLVTPLATGTGSAGFIGPILGTNFSTNSGGFVSPSLGLPALLDSNSINVSSAAGGEIFIWVTDSGISAPLTGIAPFVSTLTSNTLTGAITSLTLQTFYDAADGVFTDKTPLGSSSFTATGTATVQTNIALGGGPYSVTAVYDVVTSGAGSVNATINVAVPGPIVGAGLPGLLAAGGALVALARRRRRHAAA
jgi:hypothetical protein